MATLFEQKGRNTYYISYFLNGNRITRNTNIPLNQPKKAEIFKRELEAEIKLYKTSSKSDLNVSTSKEQNLLSHHIDQYLNLFKVNWSKGRFDNVSSTLTIFEAVLGNGVKITEIAPQVISHYILVRRKIVSVTTVRSDLQVLRTFFNYLVEEHYLLKSPISKKLIPKPEHKAIITFDEGVLKSVLNEAKLIDIKLYRALYILGATGVRPGDLLNLQFKNIDLPSNSLKIKISKTSREIIFPLYNKLRDFIISEYPDLANKNPEEKIFADFKVYSLARRFMKIKKKLNLGMDLNLKTFRKNYATTLMEEGIDGTIVAYLLGHTTVNTTSKYYLNKKTDVIRNNLNEINLDHF
jgi:integrase/recombinase XerD